VKLELGDEKRYVLGLPCVECDRVVIDTTEHLVTTETSCGYEPVYQPISLLVFHRRR